MLMVKVEILVLTIHFVLDVTVINTSCFQSSFSVTFDQILSAACWSCIPFARLAKACMVQIYAWQFLFSISLNDSPLRTKDIPFVHFKILPNYSFTCPFPFLISQLKLCLNTEENYVLFKVSSCRWLTVQVHMQCYVALSVPTSGDKSCLLLRNTFLKHRSLKKILHCCGSSLYWWHKES